MMKCQRVSIERHHLGEGGLMGPTLVLRSPAWGLKEQSRAQPGLAGKTGLTA